MSHKISFTFWTILYVEYFKQCISIIRKHMLDRWVKCWPLLLNFAQIDILTQLLWILRLGHGKREQTWNFSLWLWRYSHYLCCNLFVLVYCKIGWLHLHILFLLEVDLSDCFSSGLFLAQNLNKRCKFFCLVKLRVNFVVGYMIFKICVGRLVFSCYLCNANKWHYWLFLTV